MQVKAVLSQMRGHVANCSNDISLAANVVVSCSTWLCNVRAFVQAELKQA